MREAFFVFDFLLEIDKLEDQKRHSYQPLFTWNFLQDQAGVLGVPTGTSYNRRPVPPGGITEPNTVSENTRKLAQINFKYHFLSRNWIWAVYDPKINFIYLKLQAIFIHFFATQILLRIFTIIFAFYKLLL